MTAISVLKILIRKNICADLVLLGEKLGWSISKSIQHILEKLDIGEDNND